MYIIAEEQPNILSPYIYMGWNEVCCKAVFDSSERGRVMIVCEWMLIYSAKIGRFKLNLLNSANFKVLFLQNVFSKEKKLYICNVINNIIYLL